MECIDCLMPFLSSSSYIAVGELHGDEQLIRDVGLHGYNKAKVALEKYEPGKRILRVGMDILRNPFEATHMVKGDAVCLDHAWMRVAYRETTR